MRIFMKRLQVRLRRLRLAKGWRQVDLAKKARVSQPLISQLEAGTKASASVVPLLRVAKALGVSGGQEIGTITMKDGALVASPRTETNALALQNVLAEEVWVHQENGEPPLKLNAIHHPQEFLEHLPKEYHGSYFWAEWVED
jgi:transcriptional regulator with XRE-family HTH domain